MSEVGAVTLPDIHEHGSAIRCPRKRRHTFHLYTFVPDVAHTFARANANLGRLYRGAPVVRCPGSRDTGHPVQS